MNKANGQAQGQTKPNPLQASRILQRKCACGNHTVAPRECSKCAKKEYSLQRKTSYHAKPNDDASLSVTPAIQRKFTIGKSDDPLEQEADRIADQVLAASPSSIIDGVPPRIQRFTAQLVGQTDTAPASVDRALSSPGRSLEPALRQDMEQRFGHDFSRVRVHSGTTAEQSARELNANAYTVANNIVFGASQFVSATPEGRRLIAHELTHVVQQGHSVPQRRSYYIPSPAIRAPKSLIQRESLPRSASEDVWGLRMTRNMCGCREGIRDGIAWANTAGATYATCDTSANPTASHVEACFDAAHPGSVVVASTSSSGTMTLPPPSADPCERINNKSTFVHETMHSRHTDDMARAQGAAFFSEWKRLRGDPNRLSTLEATFPAEVAAFDAQWNSGHDWAQDEVNSYRWERRFLVDALAALTRIC